MHYRGYEFERKHLLVGWQIIVTKGDAFVQNGPITKDLESVMSEAHTYVDQLIEMLH